MNMSKVSPKKTPLPVTIISFLIFMGGIGNILSGLSAISFGGISALLTIGFGMLLLLLAILISNLKKIALWIVMAIGLFNIISGIVAYIKIGSLGISALLQFSPQTLIGSFSVIVINLVIVLYLYKSRGIFTE
jgi:hypothetical protein